MAKQQDEEFSELITRYEDEELIIARNSDGLQYFAVHTDEFGTKYAASQSNNSYRNVDKLMAIIEAQTLEITRLKKALDGSINEPVRVG